MFESIATYLVVRSRSTFTYDVGSMILNPRDSCHSRSCLGSVSSSSLCLG